MKTVGGGAILMVCKEIPVSLENKFIFNIAHDSWINFHRYYSNLFPISHLISLSDVFLGFLTFFSKFY